MCTSWFCVGLGWLPIVTGFLLALSVLVPYMIAVGLGHVTAFLPYISDTGTKPPESCVFGQLLNLTAAAAVGCIYIRMKQVQMHSTDATSVNTFNKISFVLGILACLGMSMVANFQETNLITFHMIGAIMCFGFGTVYCFLQTGISNKLRSNGRSSLCSCRVRLALSVISLVAFVMTMVFSNIAIDKAHNDKIHTDKLHWKPSNDVITFLKSMVFTNIALKKADKDKNHTDILHWKPTDDGYTEHIISSVMEWVLAISFQMFFFTFIRGFQKITIVAEVQRFSYSPLSGFDGEQRPDI